ncbi:MAG: branched-chain amino acid transaminase [Novosphingobium sp.]|jgi:branched-chain amino acid aminotransferase|uniref:branched-chain amino acid transaminase n=1 Tax=Novosphingobium sp. TaxID=1874826 RepID=UPI003017F2A6
MPLTPTKKIWMNGEMVDWANATVHIATHTLHYGTGTFEGIRVYETAQGPGFFRLTDHIKRLYRSGHILGMPMTYSVAEIVRACRDVVAASGLSSCYVRPLAYYGYGELGLDTVNCEVDIAVMCWPWASVRGDSTNKRGLRMKVSSWRRHDHNIMPPEAKTIGNYVNSSLGKAEARKAGYDDCIMLNPQGLVAECTAENIFVVRDGVIFTPPVSAGALEGLTHNTIRTMAEDLGLDVRVANLSRADLYIADEIFVCGTASEVASVASVDDREVGFPGPIGSRLQEIFAETVHGRIDQYRHWVEAL